MAILNLPELPAQLFSFLGLNNLTPKEQVEILKQIEEVISNRLLEKLLDRLDLNTADKLATAFQKNDSLEMMEILNKAIPDLQKIMNDEITSYMKELTAEVNK